MDRVLAVAGANDSAAPFQVTVQEYGTQRSGNNLSAQVTDLRGKGVPALSASLVSLVAPTTLVEPGALATLSGLVNVPQATPEGTYRGTITVKGKDAASGQEVSTSVELVLLVDRTPPLMATWDNLPDINTDGKVDEKDLALMAETQRRLVDINGDGAVDAFDYTIAGRSFSQTATLWPGEAVVQ